MKPLLAPARIQGKAPVDCIAVGGVIAESRPKLSFREPGVCPYDPVLQHERDPHRELAGADQAAVHAPRTYLQTTTFLA